MKNPTRASTSTDLVREIIQLLRSSQGAVAFFHGCYASMILLRTAYSTTSAIE